MVRSVIIKDKSKMTSKNGEDVNIWLYLQSHFVSTSGFLGSGDSFLMFLFAKIFI